MGSRSRDKGARGELEVAKIYVAGGFPLAARTPNSGGLDIKGDIGAIPLLCAEVKRCETLRIPAWMRQAVRDCPAGSIPVVHYRQNRRPWMVVVRPEDWRAVCRAWGLFTPADLPPVEIRERDGLIVLALKDWLPIFANYVTAQGVTDFPRSRPTETETRELKLSGGQA
jgi:hypothetical protein